MPRTDASILAERLAQGGQAAYREAVALQIEGDDPTEAWEYWQEYTAALLLLSWAQGAADSIRTARIDPKESMDIQPQQFARSDSPADLGFTEGPIQSVLDRFERLIPITRERWNDLIARARESAWELRQDEEGNGLQAILDRSPELQAIVRGGPLASSGALGGGKPPAAPSRPSDAFFVTGMTQRQVQQTKELLAAVVRQEASVSVAGKQLKTIGVGDFVAQTVLETGTDLTEARLQTVYRTNLNRAQTQGRLDVCRDPVVKKFVPLMRFRSTKDQRTRETHRAMDGFVATTEQIDAMGIAAPLGFNCRCSWAPISIATAVAQGWCDEDGNPDYEAIRRHNGQRQSLIDKGLVPDAGFVSG
jgi:SPP1 gp7 family putative phage head morphogenesis protein